MTYSIQQHLAYNVWANAEITGRLQSLEDSIFESEQKSSFGNIRKTLLHIWGAEVIWLHRLHGESLSKSPSEGYNGSNSALLEGFVQSGKNVLSFVESKDEAFLNSVLAYKNLKGEPFADRVEDMLYHLVNHGTYHRGQVISMLRNLDVDKLPVTDLIHYIRSVRKKN